MSKVFLGLGSNLGDRRENIEEALTSVQGVFSGQGLKVSPVYENPALLPESADPSWNIPFLNIVVESQCSAEPLWLLDKIKEIEKQLGREKKERWAPRIIDIDILLWEGVSISTDRLTIPHGSLKSRAFVLDPLKDLNPTSNLLHLARNHPRHSPLWMAILNVTPDSFSDGGKFLNRNDIDRYLSEIENHVGIIDVGAESTRPGAKPLEWEEEWGRLEHVLKYLYARYKGMRLKPQISIDTRHSEVAKRALELGVEIINDVSGLSDKRMLEIVKKSGCQYVLMHSLSIPANTNILLSKSESVTKSIKNWFGAKLSQLKEFGVPLERIILDPGVGFGKDSLQSLEILRNISDFESFPCRLLIGHSRKSVLKSSSQLPTDHLDLESVGVSLNLSQQGVDILRVHNPLFHIRTFQALECGRLVGVLQARDLAAVG